MVDDEERTVEVVELHYRPPVVSVTWREGLRTQQAICQAPGGVFVYNEIADLPWPVFAAMTQAVPEGPTALRWV